MRARFMALMATVPSCRVTSDNMMVTDSHGRIMYITTSLAHFVGYEPKEVVGALL